MRIKLEITFDDKRKLLTYIRCKQDYKMSTGLIGEMIRIALDDKIIIKGKKVRDK